MNDPLQQTNIFGAVPVSPDPFVKPKVKRVNSTSTIYAKSTIGKPDVTEIVEWYSSSYNFVNYKVWQSQFSGR